MRVRELMDHPVRFLVRFSWTAPPRRLRLADACERLFLSFSIFFFLFLFLITIHLCERKERRASVIGASGDECVSSRYFTLLFHRNKKNDRLATKTFDRETMERRRINAMLWGSAGFLDGRRPDFLGINIISCSNAKLCTELIYYYCYLLMLYYHDCYYYYY